MAKSLPHNHFTYEQIEDGFENYKNRKEKDGISVTPGSVNIDRGENEFVCKYYRIAKNGTKHADVLIIDSQCIPKVINFFHIDQMGSHCPVDFTSLSIQRYGYHIPKVQIQHFVDLCKECSTVKKMEMEKNKEKSQEEVQRKQIETLPIKTTVQPLIKTTAQPLIKTTAQPPGVSKDDPISLSLEYKGFGAKVFIQNGIVQKTGSDVSNICPTRKRKLHEIVALFRDLAEKELYDYEN